MKKTLFLIFILFFAGCAQKEPDPAPQADFCSANGFTTGSEAAECSTSTAYSPAVSITGTATFFKRKIDASTVGPNVVDLTLGAPISSALPIKYAEIRVLDASGNIVQCGKTDATGALKALDGTSTLQIPSTAGSYSVQVMARSRHSLSVPMSKPAFQVYAAVKNDTCANSVHSITGSVSSSGSGTYNTNIVAYSRETESSDIAGGAFNIYNNLITTYDYLAQNTGLANLSCLSSKLHVFWKAGFNPAQYIYSDYDPASLDNISFYLRGYNELYINGGKLGNVASTDTDHFDDAVIIHEIGHYIEDSCGKMDSPGGSHNGLFRIDPRLAWSEGWGNFFGAHIIRNNIASINPDAATDLAGHDGWLYYLDTKGYNDIGSTAGESIIKLDLSRPGNDPEALAPGVFYDKVDPVLHPGEGHFREVSIARSLFKTTNTCAASSCTDTDYFEELWLALQKISTGIGMGKTSYPFRSSIRFYNRLNEVFANAMPPAIDSILNTDEAQQRDGSSSYVSGTTTVWVPYGIKLVSTGSTPCSLALQPREENSTALIIEAYDFSDQRYSNHYYYFDRNTLPSVTEINATFTKVSGTNTDIDLILFSDGYSYPVETCLSFDTANDNCTSFTKNTGSSQFTRSDRSIASTTSTTFTKRLQNLNSFSFGTPFLLNVKAYTANKSISADTTYTYTLTDQSGGYLCPSSTF